MLTLIPVRRRPSPWSRHRVSGYSTTPDDAEPVVPSSQMDPAMDRSGTASKVVVAASSRARLTTSISDALALTR